MPEALSAALATPGLFWLITAISVAGIVRGFTGFGTALIFVPVAGQFLAAPDVILVVTLTGIGSGLALLPRAWGQADRPEVGALAAAALITVPLGVWAMYQLDGIAVRWLVAAIGAATLIALISGWRWERRLAWRGLLAVGGGAGLVGGMTGLTGPVVIVFYLANARSAQVVRANTILFLAALDVVITLTLFANDLIRAPMVWLALVIAVPYFFTSLIGQALFDPRYERLYRNLAYLVVALAVASGLPIFD